MKAMRYAVAVMTGLVIAATFYEAWFGSDVGLVLIGFAISVAGIFTLCADWRRSVTWCRRCGLWNRYPCEREDKE